MPQSTILSTAKASLVRKIDPMLFSERTLSSTTVSFILGRRRYSSIVGRLRSQIVFFSTVSETEEMSECGDGRDVIISRLGLAA